MEKKDSEDKYSLVNDFLLNLCLGGFEFTNSGFTLWTRNSDLDGDKVRIGIRIHRGQKEKEIQSNLNEMI